MNKIVLLLLAIIGLTACQTQTNNYIIKNKQVGKLTDTTTVKQMKELYKTDSIVKNTEGKSAFEPFDEYVIFDKKTKKPLFTVVSKKVDDDSSLLKYIEVKSNLFKTNKGINLESDFGTISKNQKIGKIDQTFKYIVVYLDDINATIDFPKDVLPLNIRNNSTVKMDATLIPETAKLKHLVVFLND